VGGDCDFVATGETAEEVKMALFVHAQKAHKDMLASMSPEELNKIAQKMDEILSKQ
jgi:predicted small metal-binding protein